MNALQQSRSKVVVFAISQLLFWPAIIAWVAFAGRSETASHFLPQLNRHPRVVRPRHNDQRVISDDRLREVLHMLRPKFAPDAPAKINYVDHALRFWGSKIKFDDGAMSGEQMRTLLTDHGAFREAWGNDEPPLLTRSADGIRVRTQEGRATVSHVDHLLGSLAECGTPLDFPLALPGGKAQFIDAIASAARTFSLNQQEYEWTTLVLAFYSVDGNPWVSPEGQQIDFNLLADRVMRELQPGGVCYGQHRLYTLTILLRIDAQVRSENARGLLADQARKRVKEYLMEMTARAYRTQAIEGYWDGNWPDVDRPVRDPDTNATSRRILATGHMLEWWAMAPEELHPPRETIVRAAQWLTAEIIGMDQKRIEENYTFLTHAGRALALWRGGFADEMYVRLRKERFAEKKDRLLPFER